MAAGATYEPIATTTVAVAASTITFSSIPSTYTDLNIVLTGTNTLVNSNLFMQFNGDTGTNYSYTLVYGTGAAANSASNTNDTRISLTFAGDLNTTNPHNWQASIFSYAGSTYKTVLSRHSLDNNGSGNTVAQVSLWRSTSAITSITFTAGSGTFAVGTTATLYGIKAA